MTNTKKEKKVKEAPVKDDLTLEQEKIQAEREKEMKETEDVAKKVQAILEETDYALQAFMLPPNHIGVQLPSVRLVKMPAEAAE